MRVLEHLSARFFLIISLSSLAICTQQLALSACPTYFLCNTGGAGLGDQLEHYVYCSYCAKLLNATIVLNGFTGGPIHHQGTREYQIAASLLGIDFSVSKSIVEHLDSVKLNFSQVLSLHHEIVNGSHKSACNILYLSDIYSCPGVEFGWCDFLPSYESLKSVIWKLRHNNAKQKCLDRGLGFKISSTINIVWHVRVGDICLRCDDPNYFISLYSTLMNASPLFSSHQLVFESQGAVVSLEKHEIFKRSIFYSNSSLVETICRFLTADVVITSGSSLLPFVAAFAPPWSPIILEERRKEASVGREIPHHFFNADEAILLEDGRPLLPDDEFSAVLESILREKLWQRNGGPKLFGNYSTTVVSGYWLVRNKHSTVDFSNWFKTSLRLNAPYVFFYEDDEVRALVAKFREGLPTHFIKKAVADFEVHGFYNPNWTTTPHVPSAELGMIWLEKVFCVATAAERNVFDSKWFAWVDAGNFAYRTRPIPSDRWPSDNALATLPLDKIIYTHVSDSYHHFAGTAFMYHHGIVKRVRAVFTEKIMECARLVNDWRCGNDQYIFTQLMENDPLLFFRLGDGYGDVVPILFNRS
jgi:hypothetical protein